jgi:hypothetical protein
MFKRNKKDDNILYFGQESLNDNKLYPAKNFIPEWYKLAKPKKQENFIFEDLKVNGFKHCMAFLDSFTSGYIMCTPQDIVIKRINSEENLITYSNNSYELLELRRTGDNPTLPVPMGYQDKHYAWHTYTSLKIKKDYSALVTHPLNRFDLPFLTLSGIMDLDSTVGGGNIPFFLQEGFEGVIPAGTPMAQIIPFKRENWFSKEDPLIVEEAKRSRQASFTSIGGWYKKNRWSKKEYN